MNDKDKNTGEPDIRFTVEQPNEGPDQTEIAIDVRHPNRATYRDRR